MVICAGSKSFVAKQWSHYKGLERSYENSLWRPRSDAIFGGFWYFLVFFWCFLVCVYVCVCVCVCVCMCVCVCVCVFILYMCMFCVSIVVGCSTQSMCTRTCTPCTHLRTCMYVGVHSCVTMCVCVCAHVCDAHAYVYHKCISKSSFKLECVVLQGVKSIRVVVRHSYAHLWALNEWHAGTVRIVTGDPSLLHCLHCVVTKPCYS